MIYTCDACRYTFEDDAAITQCPDCGKFAVRIATEEEETEYRNRALEEWDEDEMFNEKSEKGNV